MRRTANFERFNASQRQALDTCRNLAVRANAGSGKTSVMVERIVQLLAKSWDDGAPLELSSIVAITFTRKAAAELQERLAESFRQLSLSRNDAHEQVYWIALTEELPRAMVGTIDSFCGRILREFGLLDPGWDRIESDFEPLEGYDEAVLKREAINRVLNRLSSLPTGGLDAEEAAQAESCRWWAVEEGYDTLVRHLEALLNHVLDPETIIAAHENLPPATMRVQEEWAALPIVQRLKQERSPLLRQLRDLDCAIAAVQNPGMKLLELREGIKKTMALVDSSSPRSDAQALRTLAQTLLTEEQTPRQHGLAKVAERLVPLQEAWCPLLQGFEFDYDGEVRAREAADRLVQLLGPVHAEYLRLCRRANRFDFLTLARRTRNLLKTHPEIREQLKRRWRYVLVDEFQDTNELQWEIISWIVGTGPNSPLDADRLFIVGDPQQSIYRFRHADVGVFKRVEECIQSSNQQHGHAERPTVYDRWSKSPSSDPRQRLGLMPLAENYRSLSPMPLGLMDRVFRHVFDPSAHGLDLEHNVFEVRYQPLEAGLKTNDPNVGGEVRYVIPFGQEDDETLDEEMPGEQEERAPAGDALGRLQVRAVVDQLVALYSQPKHTAAEGQSQTLHWSDMAVLLPSRTTVLTQLEKEFHLRQVPFIVTKGIGFWQRQEIRDVTNLAICLADSGDELALFAVLRSPLVQLSVTEILFLSELGQGSLMRGLDASLRFGEELSSSVNSEPREQQGREHLPAAPCPRRDSLSMVWREFTQLSKDRVRRTAARLGTHPLGSWRRRVDRMAHADLLQRCLEESGAYAIYAAAVEGEIMLANLERLFDLIRGEEERSAAGLIRLARWLRAQMEDSLREEQAPLASERKGVQIMTVHAAKGLEFPVVAVMKMERKADLCSPARLLVTNAGEHLLPGDAAVLGEPKPGTVAVKVRHPRRPRETFAPRLFKALHRLDQAQQLAESRRLFYVAATRAKERLILAGRQLSRPGLQPESWQKWFEEALGITQEHLSQSVWQDAAQAHMVQIITGLAARDPVVESKPFAPDTPLALGYIHERPQRPTLATTSLEPMRELWKQKPWEWWLKYRHQVDAHVSLPDINPVRSPADPNAAHLGAAVGTLVHRLFEMPGALQQQRPEAFRKLLQAMAANLLLAPSPLADPGDREDPVPADQETILVVVDAVEQIWRRLYGISGGKIRALLEAAGDTEVPFMLNLGRWQIAGRYDKLLAFHGSFEIIDWKTYQEDEPDDIVTRYEPQMKLYALALYRAGLAGLVEGKVRVHLAMLHPMVVKPLYFSPVNLEAFANELVHELEQLDAYEPP